MLQVHKELAQLGIAARRVQQVPLAQLLLDLLVIADLQVQQVLLVLQVSRAQLVQVLLALAFG